MYPSLHISNESFVFGWNKNVFIKHNSTTIVFSRCFFIVRKNRYEQQLATVGSKNILLTGSGRGSHVPHSRIKNKEENKNLLL